MHFIGHTWKADPRISPRLVTAVDRERVYPRVCLRLVNPLWVLDYSKIRIGRTRVGSPRAAWRPRAARIAHLYPPLTPYWEDYGPDAPQPQRSTFVIFDRGNCAGLTRFTQNPFGYGRFIDRSGVLLGMLEEIARIGQRAGESGFWDAQALLCRAIGLIQRSTPLKDEEYDLPATTGVPAADSLATLVDDYLRTHLPERLNLAGLAPRFNVSVSTLAHRYRAETGVSPMARLIQMRVSMARGLLLKGERLDIVAEQTGFYDAFHLSKTFKRLVGLSPRRFLQVARQDVQESWEATRRPVAEASVVTRSPRRASRPPAVDVATRDRGC